MCAPGESGRPPLGWPTHPSSGEFARWRIDGLIVDTQKKVLTIIELRPDDQRAIQRGQAQVAQYADDVADLIKNKVGRWAEYTDYVIRTEVRTYTK